MIFKELIPHPRLEAELAKPFVAISLLFCRFIAVKGPRETIQRISTTIGAKTAAFNNGKLV